MSIMIRAGVVTDATALAELGLPELSARLLPPIIGRKTSHCTTRTPMGRPNRRGNSPTPTSQRY